MHTIFPPRKGSIVVYFLRRSSSYGSMRRIIFPFSFRCGFASSKNFLVRAFLRFRMKRYVIFVMMVPLGMNDLTYSNILLPVPEETFP